MKAVNNEAAVRAMPGVLDVVTIDSGVAVVAETFGQALDGKEALDVTWGPGSVDALSDDAITARLKAATPSLDVLGLLVKKVEGSSTSHSPVTRRWRPTRRSPTYGPTVPRSGPG